MADLCRVAARPGQLVTGPGSLVPPWSPRARFVTRYFSNKLTLPLLPSSDAMRSTVLLDLVTHPKSEVRRSTMRSSQSLKQRRDETQFETTQKLPMPFSGSNGHALAKCILNLFGLSGPLAPDHMHGAIWAQKPKPLASIGEAYAQRDRPLTRGGPPHTTLVGASPAARGPRGRHRTLLYSLRRFSIRHGGYEAAGAPHRCGCRRESGGLRRQVAAYRWRNGLACAAGLRDCQVRD